MANRQTYQIHLSVLLEPSSVENSKAATAMIKFGSFFLFVDTSRIKTAVTVATLV